MKSLTAIIELADAMWPSAQKEDPSFDEYSWKTGFITASLINQIKVDWEAGE